MWKGKFAALNSKEFFTSIDYDSNGTISLD